MVDIGTVFTQWQAFGVYEYLLPFLLVFAIVFGVLSTSNLLGKHKGIHIIIAIVVGLMAVGYSTSLQYSLGQFLQTLFPRLGVGIAIILSLMILVGLFINQEERKYWMWGLSAIGLIIAIVIVTESLQSLTWWSVGSYSDYVGWIIGAVLLLGVIIAVAASGGSDK